MRLYHKARGLHDESPHSHQALTAFHLASDESLFTRAT
jgi:hypothetical protein